MNQALKFRAVLIVMVFWSTCFTSFAQEVPLSLQAKLMLKVMSMDRNFERFGDTVKIGVSSDAMLSELASQSELQIKEKPFVAVKMDSPEDIEEYKIVYIDRNWQEDYGLVARKAEENKALIFAADENYVTTGGGSICFKTFDAKPKIVINLQNVKKQGSDFPANFLKITTVVGLIE